MSAGQAPHHTPRDGKVMAAILKDAGVEDYEPRVINQMLEFAYRYVSDVLDDARVYSEYSAKKSIDADDVRLAVQMKVENTLTNPPSREMLSELAQEKNAIPLPALKQQYGLRLPPDRYCTLQPNFCLKSTPAATSGAGTRTGSVSSTSTPGAIGMPQQPAFRSLGQQSRPKQVASPTVMQKPKPAGVSQAGTSDQSSISTAIAAAKPATAASTAKPLFRLVSGSSATSSAPRPTLSAQSDTTAAAAGGIKRKLETLDEDYDNM